MEIGVKLRKRQNKVWHGFSAQKYILEYHTQYHTQPFELGRKFGVKFPRKEMMKQGKMKQGRKILNVPMIVFLDCSREAQQGFERNFS